tara:strand:+ start:21 stop:521 length:501 start_codon:yes stop_codon:yes gene_type:complete
MEGFIYKVEVNQSCYVGSTFQRLSQRAASHNREIRNNNQSKFYNFLRENNIKKVNCELLERINIENIENKMNEMFLKEQEWIDKIDPTLNTNRAYTDRDDYVKEYNEKNKEKTKKRMLIYNKNYYIENKEKLCSKYTCICGKTLSYSGKSAHEKSNRHLIKLKINF